MGKTGLFRVPYSTGVWGVFFYYLTVFLWRMLRKLNEMLRMHIGSKLIKLSFLNNRLMELIFCSVSLGYTQIKSIDQM